MEVFWASCKKDIANKNYSVKKTRQNRLNLVLNCDILGQKKSIFIKILEANGFLSNLEIRTPLSNVL